MANTINPDSKHLLEELVREAQTNGLVLFVGAGINSKSLPLWIDLLKTLFSEAIAIAEAEDPRVGQWRELMTEWCDNHFDVCAQASILKNMLGSERYRLAIQDALYSPLPKPEYTVREYCKQRKDGGKKDSNYELLWRVAELASQPQVKAVATFNFDTLLEAAISEYGERNPRAYFGQTASPDISSGPKNPVIPIFHLHGLISPPDTLLRNPHESVVFSYDEYFEKNADPLSWETSTPIHLLRNFTTLWIGASLKDWNMLRMLDAALTGRQTVRSYCIQSLMEAGHKDDPKLLDFKKAAMRFQATLFESVGLQLIIGGETFPSIADTIFNNITIPLKDYELADVKSTYKPPCQNAH